MRFNEWLIVGLVTLVFAPALLHMSEVWRSVDYYSHGFLVPLVALWAASAERGRLAKLPSQRDLRGAGALVAALAAYAVGLTGSMLWLEGLAVVAAVGATVLFLRGAAWLGALRFAVGFLVFMIPLPTTWTAPLITWLQLWVSRVGVAILRFFGTSIYREGNVLVLPGGEELFVAEACSGITSIITLLPLAVFLGYFTERSWRRRGLLVLAVVPVAMAGNLLRVIGTVWAARHWGAEAVTTGPAHEFAGLAVYLLGCVLLIGIGMLLRSPAAAQRVS